MTDTIKQAIEALEETLAWAIRETEYDGRMYDICNSCGGQDGAHEKSCKLPQFNSALALLRAEAANEEWMPIEGVPVGTLHPYDRREGAATFVHYWNGLHQGIGYAVEDDDYGEIRYVDESGDYIEPRPTHYRPLPVPPASGEKGGGA